MEIKNRFLCLLTSGRIFEIRYGGEEKFSNSFGEWLVRKGIRVILMGSRFASVEARTMTTVTDFKKLESKINENTKVRAASTPYVIYLLSRFMLSLLWIIKILTLNLRYPISLIHSQDTGYSGLAAIIGGKILRIPVVVTSHGVRHRTLKSILSGPFRKLFLGIEYRIDIFTVKNANIVIAINPSIKEYFEKKCRRKVEFIPISIDPERFTFSEINRENVRKELGLDNNVVVIGFVGRFSEEKNLDTLVASFIKARQNFSNLKLVMVGAGSVEIRLRQTIKSEGLENDVIFCGVRYDVEKILSAIDIFVLPSFTEGLSTSLLEAMASGRAIICSNIDANKVLVTQNKNGILVDPKNRVELQNAIELLYSNKQLRTNLGLQAKVTVLGYSNESVFPKILDIYKELLNNSEGNYRIPFNSRR